MIADSNNNWNKYHFGRTWAKAFEFLLTISPDMEEKDYPIDGKDIYARITSYDAVSTDSAMVEAHKVYVDIHSPLINAEGIGWFNPNVLEIKTPYNMENDAVFYLKAGNSGSVINICPGAFAVFFPYEAHMPKLFVPGNGKPIKKIVVKVKYQLLSGEV